MITKIKNYQLTKHILCDCRCKFDSTKCNSNQKRNKALCRCECKNLTKDLCEKNYVWNPSTFK